MTVDSPLIYSALTMTSISEVIHTGTMTVEEARSRKKEWGHVEKEEEQVDYLGLMIEG